MILLPFRCKPAHKVAGDDVHSLPEMFNSRSVPSLAVQPSVSQRSPSFLYRELLMVHILYGFSAMPSLTFLQLFKIYSKLLVACQAFPYRCFLFAPVNHVHSVDAKVVCGCVVAVTFGKLVSLH